MQKFKVLQNFRSGGSLGGVYHALGREGEVIALNESDPEVQRYVELEILSPLGEPDSDEIEIEEEVDEVPVSKKKKKGK